MPLFLFMTNACVPEPLCFRLKHALFLSSHIDKHTGSSAYHLFVVVITTMLVELLTANASVWFSVVCLMWPPVYSQSAFMSHYISLREYLQDTEVLPQQCLSVGFCFMHHGFLRTPLLQQLLSTFTGTLRMICLPGVQQYILTTCHVHVSLKKSKTNKSIQMRWRIDAGDRCKWCVFIFPLVSVGRNWIKLKWHNESHSTSKAV